MTGRFSLTIAAIAAAALLLPATVQAQQGGNAAAPAASDAVTFYGSPQSPIAGGVIVPAGRAYLWTSGTVPSPADPNARPGSRERYGDTKTQAVSILKNIEAQLKEKGLTLKDVVYLRVYVVADPMKENKPDYAGWFDAYAQFFNTKDNPTRVARSTVGVASLVNPDWLIEIEAVAVFPATGTAAAKK